MSATLAPIGIKDRLVAGLAVEKEYLKARSAIHSQTDFTSSDLAKVEDDFIAKLAPLGFSSISDYHFNVSLYGHCWRILRVIFGAADEIPNMIQKAIKDNEDHFGYNFFKKTSVLVPDANNPDEFINVDFCKKEKIIIGSHMGHGGAALFSPGNFGVMLTFHKPVNPDSLGDKLAETVKNMLSKIYGIETKRDGNDLLYDDKKVWGTTVADLGEVCIAAGPLSLEFDSELASKVIKERPGHPTIKKPSSLNEMTGKKIKSDECLRFLITEWLEATNSKTTDEEWQKKL